jgi:hypothetical protein
MPPDEAAYRAKTATRSVAKTQIAVVSHERMLKPINWREWHSIFYSTKGQRYCFTDGCS